MPCRQHSIGRKSADCRRGCARPDRAEFAFLVVKAWGEGENGYGPTRAVEWLNSRRIRESAFSRLPSGVQDGRPRGYELLSDGGECRIFNLVRCSGRSSCTSANRQQSDRAPSSTTKTSATGSTATLASPLVHGLVAGRYRAYLTQMHAWGLVNSAVNPRTSSCACSGPPFRRRISGNED